MGNYGGKSMTEVIRLHQEALNDFPKLSNDDIRLSVMGSERAKERICIEWFCDNVPDNYELITEPPLLLP